MLPEIGCKLLLKTVFNIYDGPAKVIDKPDGEQIAVKSFYINDPIWLQMGRKTIKIMKEDTYNGNVLRY